MTKRHWTTRLWVILPVLLLTMLVCSVALADLTDGNYTFSVYSSNYARITGYTGNDVDLVLPETLTSGGHTYTVTTVADGAFSTDNKVTNNSVRAFSKVLRSVTMSDHITTIGEKAFFGCTALEQVRLNKTMTVGDEAFSGCTSLVNVDFNVWGTTQSKVTGLGSKVFKGCTSLKKINLPDGVTTIGENLFEKCTALEEANIPMSMTYVPVAMFQECSALKKVRSLSGNANLTKIDSYAFYNCSSLEPVVLGSKLTSVGECAFYGAIPNWDVVIPSSVSDVGNYAFHHIPGLRIRFAGDVFGTIGQYAFGGTLFNVKDDSHIMYWHKHTANDAVIAASDVQNNQKYSSTVNLMVPGLQYVTYQKTDAVTGRAYGAAMILGYTGRSSDLVIPDLIYEYTDDKYTLNCTPYVVESIYEGAFAYSSLRSITLPSTLTSIGKNAFAGSMLQEIIFPGAYTIPNPHYDPAAGKNTLYAETFYIGVKTPPAGKDSYKTRVDIAEGAFRDCSYLTSVRMPSAQETIPDYAFYNDASIVTVSSDSGIILPDTIKSIGAHAFEMPYDKAFNAAGKATGYGSLTDVRLENLIHLKSLGEEAFANNTSMQYVSLYGYCTVIGDLAFVNTRTEELANETFHIHCDLGSYIDGWARDHGIPRAFTWDHADGEALTGSLDVNNHNNTLDFTWKIDYEAGTAVVTGLSADGYQYLAGKGQGMLVVPSHINGVEVTGIGEYAFAGENVIERVELPDTIRTIDAYAFAYCGSMVDVNISSLRRLTTIGEYAFAGTKLAYAITLPKTLTSIGANAFADTAPYGIYAINDLSSASIITLLKGTGLGVRVSTDSPWCYAWHADGLVELVRYENGYNHEINRPENWPSTTVYQFPWEAYKLDYIGYRAFYGMKISDKVDAFVIPAVQIIGEEAFADMMTDWSTGFGLMNDSNRRTLTINAREIGYGAFNAAGLVAPANTNAVVLSGNVRTINAMAFANNPKLEYIVIPASVAYIDPMAFGNRTNMPKLTVVVNTQYQYDQLKNSGVTVVRNGSSLPAFNYRVVNNQAIITRYNGTLGYGNAYHLWDSQGILGIPSTLDGLTVVGIDDGALKNIEYDRTQMTGSATGGYALRHLFIPDTITFIGDEAFAGNDKLEQVYFEGNQKLKWIGYRAFADTPWLRKINIPESVREIYDYAFSGSGLVKNTFGDAEYEPIVIPGTVEYFDWNAFVSENGEFIPVYVEHGSKAEVYVQERGFGRYTESTPDGKYCYIGYDNSKTDSRFVSARDGVLTGSTCTDRVIVVPAALNGKPVTTIGANVFKGLKTVDVIIMPTTVTTIEASAFEDCSVRYINFGELPALSNIGERAFYGSGLKNKIDINPALNNFSIGKSAFDGANSDKRWYEAKNFGNSAIGRLADSGLATRVEGGLYVSDGWEDAYSADGLSYAGFKWSNETISVSHWFVDEGATDITANVGRMSFTNNYHIATGAFANVPNLRTVNLNGVDVIEAKAFAYSQDLQKININDGTTTIEDNAFFGCSNLREVRIPESVTNITANAFKNCAANLVIICKRGSVADGVFSNSDFTVKYDPKEEEEPEYSAKGFVYEVYEDKNDGGKLKAHILSYEGTNKTYLRIPARLNDYPVGRIDGESFSDLKDITRSIVIEEGTADNGYLVIASATFENFTALESVEIARKVSSLQPYTFRNCQNLISLVMSDGMQSIETNALEGCVSLQNIVIPGTVRTIPSNMFAGKTNLRSVVLQEGVQKIGQGAFFGCTGLRSIKLPASIDSRNGANAIYPDGFNYNLTLATTSAFGGIKDQACNVDVYVVSGSYAEKYFNDYNITCATVNTFKFNVITKETESTDWAWETASITQQVDDEQYETYDAKVLVYKGSASVVTVPSVFEGRTVTGVYSQTFKNVKDSLTKVYLPLSVQIIGDKAFEGFTALRYVDAPSVSSIGDKAFSYDANLIAVKAPVVASIGERAFEETRNMQSFNFPVTIQSIGERAFYNSSVTRDPGTSDPDDPDTTKTIDTKEMYNFYSMVVNSPSIGADAFSYDVGAIRTPRRYIYTYGTFTAEAANSLIGTGLPFVNAVDVNNVNSAIGYVYNGDGTFNMVCWIDDNVSGTAKYNPVVNNSGITLSEYAFKDGSFEIMNLQVLAPNGILPAHAFDGCNNLKWLAVGNSISSIADYAFSNCGKAYLDSELADAPYYKYDNRNKDAGWIIELPNTITSIGQHAFDGCFGPGKKLYVRTWKNSIVDTMFKDYDDNLVLIYYDAQTPVTVGPDWMYRTVTYDKVTGLEISGYMNLKAETLEIPVSIGNTTVIGIGQGLWGTSDNAPFVSTSSLKKLTLPATVLYIGENAFRGNHQLQELNFMTGSLLKEIGKNAFTDCVLGAKNELRLPDTVEKIDDHAFDNTTMTIIVKEGSAAERIIIDHNARANKYEDDDLEPWNYRVIENSKYDFTVVGSTITGYTGRSEVMSIPSEINGVTITAIAADAFNCEADGKDDLSFVNRVYIPASITNIGDRAFANMSGLTKLEFEQKNSGLTIGEKAFYKTNLSGEIVLPDVIIDAGNQSFDTVTRLVYARIEGGVQNAVALENSYLSIRPALKDLDGGDAYNEEMKLEDVFGLQWHNGMIETLHCFESSQYITVPDCVEAIGAQTFIGSSVIRVILPKTLLSVAEEAFAGCASLQYINLEETQVFEIGDKAFANCQSLNELKLPYWNEDALSGYNTVESIGENVFLNSDHFIHVWMWKACTAGYVLDNTTAKVFYYDDQGGETLDGLFYDFQNDGTCVVTSYRGDTAPSVIDIPETATDNNGKEYTVTGIKARAFIGREEITQINLPDTIQTIGANAFDGTSITELDLSGTQMTEIFNSSLAYMDKLTTVKLPESIAIIEDGAFIGDGQLTDVSPLTSALTEIGADVFNGTALTELDLSDTSLTRIEVNAFENMTSLTTVKLPESVTEICGNAFKGDAALTDINMPAALDFIGNNAFDGCAALSEIQIPDSVTMIGDEVFKDTALTEITIPASVTYIGNSVFAGTMITELDLSAFAPESTVLANGALDNSSIDTVKVPSRKGTLANDARAWQNEGEGRKVIYGDDPSKILTLPAMLTTIESEAFAGVNVDRIIIPEGVTTIEANAFSGATIGDIVLMGNDPDMIDIDAAAFNGMNGGALTTVYAQQDMCNALKYTFRKVVTFSSEYFE